MKSIHRILLAGTACGATLLSLPTLAQHDHHAAFASAAPAKAADMSEGEVRKVDLADKKITLRHGPLKNLDMPGMTMAFQVSDPAMLGQVKVGDKVRFVADSRGGKLTIMRIEPAR